MDAAELYKKMIGRERNIYELGELYPQVRHDPSHYLETLKCPACNSMDLKPEEKFLQCNHCGKKYPVSERVVDFREVVKKNSQWESLNEQFLNYHRSLTAFTLLNAVPVHNYISIKSGIGKLKNIRVLDVGGGTGQMYCAFFRNPETIDYFLYDPNLRLLHDQFIRVYPWLSELPVSHFMGFAESLPFRDATFDLVMSYSSIDHFIDYHRFIAEAWRVLKPGGILFISSHLDKPVPRPSLIQRLRKLLSPPVLERIQRSFYYRKYQVGHDDHTYHFENARPIREAMEKQGFTIEADEEVKNFFFLKGIR